MHNNVVKIDLRRM